MAGGDRAFSQISLRICGIVLFSGSGTLDASSYLAGNDISSQLVARTAAAASQGEPGNDRAMKMRLRRSGGGEARRTPAGTCKKSPTGEYGTRMRPRYAASARRPNNAETERHAETKSK